MDEELNAAALEVKRLATEAQAELMRLIALTDTLLSVQKVKTIQQKFNASFTELLAQRLTSAGTGDVWDVRMVKDMKVGDVSLAKRLYTNATQTSNEVAAIVKEHAKGNMQARDLAIRLYDGYDPKDGIKRPLEGRARAKLPNALKQLTANPVDRAALQQVYEQGQRYAATLKTEPLKAAYLQALKAWEKDKGAGALSRALDIAHKEKTRYMANRIAQTELARAHQHALADELMADTTIDVVQVKMSAAHPLTDICDLHSKADLFNLGPGCYPKARAPKPPFHPHCKCRLRSRPDLMASAAREKPGGEAAYLREVGVVQASRIMGSRAKLQRMLNGAKLDDVVNAAKNPLYRFQRLGDVAKVPVVPKVPVPPIAPVVPVSPVVAIDNAAMKSPVAPPWESDFPQVTTHTSVTKLKRTGLLPVEKLNDKNESPLYAAAKHQGNRIAARKVAQELVHENKILELQLLHPDAVLVPVHKLGAAAANQLPNALADVMRDIGGWQVDDGIVETVKDAAKKMSHSGAKAMERLLRVPVFDGPVKAGQEYIIIDDVTTSGSALSALRHYIAARGGKVVHATSFATASSMQTGYGGLLAPLPKTLDLVRNKFDTNALDALLSGEGIAPSYTHLTTSQARYVNTFGTLESFRKALQAVKSAGN